MRELFTARELELMANMAIHFNERQLDGVRWRDEYMALKYKLKVSQDARRLRVKDSLIYIGDE